MRGALSTQNVPPQPQVWGGVMWRAVSALAVLFKRGPQKESCADGTVKHLGYGGVYMKVYLE